MAAVFNVNGSYRPEVEGLLGVDDGSYQPVLIASTLTLDPAERGQGLGLAVFRAFLDTFEPGAAICIAHGSPMNAPDLTPEEQATPAWQATRQQGVERLGRYWQALGFVPLADAPEYLLLDLTKPARPVARVIEAARKRPRPTSPIDRSKVGRRFGRRKAPKTP